MRVCTSLVALLALSAIGTHTFADEKTDEVSRYDSVQAGFAIVTAKSPATGSLERYLRRRALPKEFIDHFLADPTSTMKLDPDLGYAPANGIDAGYGIDGSSTINTYQTDGTRTSFVYANKPSRLNTYGDSYTHGDQVNDAETWQEYLAGHLGEPIRNLGIGGHGVYQAYRRMLREETTDHGAKYLILYICCEDSTVSLFAALRGSDSAV